MVGDPGWEAYITVHEYNDCKRHEDGNNSAVMIIERCWQ